MNHHLCIAVLGVISGMIFTACGGQAEPVEKINPGSAVETVNASITVVPPTPVGGVKVEGPDDYVGLVKQAWSIVKANYVRDDFNGADWPAVYDEYVALAEDVSSSEELWILLADLIGELNDDHSRFVPPERMTAEFGIETSDAPGGRPATGIIIWPGPGREDEYLTIWDVCGLSSAAMASLTRGDIILAVDGHRVEKIDDEFSPDFRAGIVFGAGGDSVTLNVWQGPGLDPVDITLPLGVVGNCPYRYFTTVNDDPKIAYIRLPDFAGDTEDYLLRALSELERDEPLDGLIVDVRHNHGGNSAASTEIFAEGIVGTDGPLREGKSRSIYRIQRPVGWNETTPLVVLIDGSSHSAADKFPAALKELNRAAIVGMNSAGNTEGINSWILADGTLIRLAWTILVLNDGTVLEGIGVTPDVIVPLGTWGLKAEPYDTQIQAGIDTLLEMIGD